WLRGALKRARDSEQEQDQDLGPRHAPHARTLYARAALQLHYRFGARGDVQFLVDVVNVFADRVETDAHRVRDFLVTESLGKQCQGFLLTFGKLVRLRGGSAQLVKIMHDLARDFSRHGRAAEPRFRDRFEQFVG